MASPLLFFFFLPLHLGYQRALTGWKTFFSSSFRERQGGRHYVSKRDSDVDLFPFFPFFFFSLLFTAELRLCRSSPGRSSQSEVFDCGSPPFLFLSLLRTLGEDQRIRGCRSGRSFHGSTPLARVTTPRRRGVELFFPFSPPSLKGNWPTGRREHLSGTWRGETAGMSSPSPFFFLCPVLTGRA